MHANKSLLILFSVLLSFNCTSCQEKEEILSQKERQWLNEHPNLTAAVNPTYAPYQYINDEGELDGIFVGFMNLIEERIGYRFKRKLYDNWNDVILDAKAETIDLVLEIQETSDRKEYLNFSTSLVSQPYVLVAHETIPVNIEKSFFRGKKIGVIKNYSVEEYLRKKHAKVEIVPVVNDEEGFKMLAHGEIDAFISLRAIANFFINQKGYRNYRINRELTYLNELSIANLRKYDVLTDIITKAVNSITPKERREIFENWSYSLVKPLYQNIWFWFALLLLLSIMLVLFASLNKILKRKVNEKTMELAIAKDQAEESSRLKTTFLQNISHEIRTPVNAIVGFSDMIYKGDIPKEEEPKFLEVIKHSGEHLITVIDDILEISNLNTKKVAPQYSNVDITELLNELVSIFQVNIEQKNIELNLDSPQGVNAITDKTKLRKVLRIIIDNAIKNTERGSINIKFKPTDNTLIFIIEDTGKGIPKELLSNIFRRFEKSSKEIKNFDEGLGLGLSIAKENIELLSGTIEVISEVNEGAQFTVTIPYQREKVERSLEYNQEKVAELGIKSVLVAEDGHVNFLVLKKQLLRLLGEDITIIHAENGALAVEAIAQQPELELVFMDIKMPVMDGFEATKKIKIERPNIPIVAQTAYAASEDQQKAFDSGCVGVITKPIKSKDLVEVLSKIFVN